MPTVEEIYREAERLRKLRREQPAEDLPVEIKIYSSKFWK
jgi:hypothetical protein